VSTSETEPTPPEDRAAQPTGDALSQSGADADRSPEQIQAEIETAREELGETVAALAEKADVKAQAKKKVDETKVQVQEKVAGAIETAGTRAQDFSGRAQEAAPESAGEAAEQARQAARENPVPAVALGVLLLGFVIWLFGRR